MEWERIFRRYNTAYFNKFTVLKFLKKEKRKKDKKQVL